MDIERYLRRKALGLSVIAKEGEAIVLIEKRFDPETGAEVTPKREYLNVKALEDKRKQLNSDLEKIESQLTIISEALSSSEE